MSDKKGRLTFGNLLQALLKLVRIVRASPAKWRKRILSIKGVVFTYHWILPVAGVGAYLAALTNRENISLMICTTIVSGVFALTFFIQQQKLKESEFFYRCFADFNSRYELLRPNLEKILHVGSIQEHERDSAIKYFNLCAEEFLVYKMGCVPLHVWTAWLSGMDYYWQSVVLRKLWDKELAGNSYYDFSPLEEFSAYLINHEPTTDSVNSEITRCAS